MRNLTIKRTKSFVASLASMKVYIEDHDRNELEINGVPCRKLGVLKNGEQQTFSVPEHAAKIFVIADKLSKGISSEFYELPAGTEDVSLSGKNHYNPGAGNPFYFDGEVSEAVLQNRKKIKKKSIIVLIVAAIVGFAVGWLGTTSALNKVEPKNFTVDGMQITLTNQFRKQSVDGFNACYGSEEAAVLILKESFSLVEGFEAYTLEEYGQLVLESNGNDPSMQLQRSDGLTFFEFQSPGSDGETMNYICVMEKGPDAFWLVQFAVYASDYERLRPSIMGWASSIVFTEN